MRDDDTFDEVYISSSSIPPTMPIPLSSRSQGLNQSSTSGGELPPCLVRSLSGPPTTAGFSLRPKSPSSKAALGNLFLSSCPGKKGTSCFSQSLLDLTQFFSVRLDGPVNGRSSVCRDLKQDLQRMKFLGVRCIVWLVARSNYLTHMGAWFINSTFHAVQLFRRRGASIPRLPLGRVLARSGSTGPRRTPVSHVRPMDRRERSTC